MCTVGHAQTLRSCSKTKNDPQFTTHNRIYALKNCTVALVFIRFNIRIAQSSTSLPTLPYYRNRTPFPTMTRFPHFALITTDEKHNQLQV